MPRKNWKELRGRMAPERREANERVAERMLVAMDLDELRRARNVTQEELASRLGVHQSSVSKLTRRPDVHLSSLRDVVRALGGELEVVAHFPDQDVRVTRFSESEETS